jgi:hypothetical protein
MGRPHFVLGASPRWRSRYEQNLAAVSSTTKFELSSIWIGRGWTGEKRFEHDDKRHPVYDTISRAGLEI